MDKDLLFSITKDDFTFDYFSGSGPGGQHKNRHKNCVRCFHKESGAVGTGQEERVLNQNKKNAFKRCVKSKEFQIWLNKKIYECQKGITFDKKIDEMIKPENIKIETWDDDKWLEL